LHKPLKNGHISHNKQKQGDIIMFKGAIIRLRSLFGEKAIILPQPEIVAQTLPPISQVKPAETTSKPKPTYFAEFNTTNEATVHMVAMMKVIMLAQDAILKHIYKGDNLRSEQEELAIKKTIELSKVAQKDASLCTSMTQRYGTMQRASFLAGKIDMAIFRPLIIETDDKLRQMSTHCTNYLKIIGDLESVTLLPRADEIQTKLTAAIEKSEGVSKKLQSTYLKSFNYDSPPSHLTQQP
jgi:hypothetical protein